jgi:thiamine pyrophosphate-dependent acetolactate synthase large subunit-like protein
MEWDTLVRHGVHVVSVIGNNGIWALEKHPMEMLYGYSVVRSRNRCIAATPSCTPSN